MRRGYDIDQGTDQPDELKFPVNPGIDHNRCVGGGVNSLSWALASAHIAYNPQKIVRGDIEHQLSQIYEMIIADHVDDIKNIISPKERNVWASNNKVTGHTRDYLDGIFHDKYLQDFENDFKGYVPDDAFYSLIEQGLDNVKMPEAISTGIEQMGFDEIKGAISEGLLPLLHLDQDHGYESTLNYLSRLPKKAGLVKDLYKFAVTKNVLGVFKFPFISTGMIDNKLGLA